MYICICNAIRENDFRAVVHDHPDACAEDIYIAFGRPPQCGQCLDEANALLKEECEARKLPVFCAD